MEAFQNGAKIEGIVSDEGWDGSTTCQWSEKFTDRLFGALVAIIEAHGVGVDGWESARWEVYDRVRPLFSIYPHKSSLTSHRIVRRMLWERLVFSRDARQWPHSYVEG